ncbi:MAG: IS21 family transposase [Bacteroidales bacterium]|nr:IS21 family transposase [Bacteroidales bacterium]
MSNKNIEMSKLRQILKLYASHKQGTRTIRDVTGVSRTTIMKYIELFRTSRITWDELSTLSDKDLDDLFHTDIEIPEPPEREKELYAFFPQVEKRIKQPGMTLLKLWKEYSDKTIDGYQSTGFYKHYRLWKGLSHPSMHMVHKAGDKMFVDFTGKKLEVIDVSTGEIKTVEVFVAILGASQLTYVEALERQDITDFITGCENALYYFGGAPAAIVPDNLKSAVTKTNRYEPTMNHNFEAFAEHYGMVVLPARAYKPKDKPLVEGAVKIAYNRIFTNLHGQKFYSLAELNEAIMRHLENHNKALFVGRTYSRIDQFNDIEKQVLQPLPFMRFEIRENVQVTVMKNGHACLHRDKHYYSVPSNHVGKKVKIFFSKTTVDIYYKYELIANHLRSKAPHGYTTVREHMATYNNEILEWNPQRFIDDANKIHSDVGFYISLVISNKAHPEQAYKSCQGILSFAKRVGNERLINACRRAHQYGVFHYKIIETILQRNLDQYDMDDEIHPMPAHDNIRGEEYYK